MAEVAGYVALTLKFEREGRNWVGVCLELGTSTFARSLEQAQTELHELITAHLHALEQEGERERFFAEHHITFHSAIPKKRKFELPVDWNRYITDTSSHGPLFQPHLFPVPPVKEREAEYAGV